MPRLKDDFVRRQRMSFQLARPDIMKAKQKLYFRHTTAFHDRVQAENRHRVGQINDGQLAEVMC